MKRNKKQTMEWLGEASAREYWTAKHIQTEAKRKCTILAKAIFERINQLKR